MKEHAFTIVTYMSWGFSDGIAFLVNYGEPFHDDEFRSAKIRKKGLTPSIPLSAEHTEHR
jgi:hypothetical protein